MVQWGHNDDGQRDDFPEGIKVRAVACGDNHSVAIKEDGTMVQWGSNDDDQRTDFPEGIKVKAVACGGGFSVAIKEDGTMIQWGATDLGQRTVFPEGMKVRAVACGFRHSVAIKEDRTMVQWGYDSDSRRVGFPSRETSTAPTLKGRTDPNLTPTFTTVVRPHSYVSKATAYPKVSVFDIVGQEDVPIDEYILADPGNHFVFRHDGKNYGIEIIPILQRITNGEGIFYECTREFNMAVAYGTFDFKDIYAQPYIEIPLASRFYIPFQEFQQIVSIPTHVLWEIVPTGKVLKHAASRSSVIAGGPVMSQLHCQAGSDLSVFTIKPFTLASDSAPVVTSSVELYVNVKMGETTDRIDITTDNTYDAVRSKYATLKNMNPNTIQFIYGGGPVRDYSVHVTPGTTIIARQIGGGRRRTYRRKIQ